MSATGSVLGGTMAVVTSQKGGHGPEFWAERATARLVRVAETAPPVIRDQAIAFRDSVHVIISAHINEAVRSDRSSLALRLREAGQFEAAEIVERV